MLVKWLVEEAGRDQALAVLEDVAKRPRSFAVPDLVWYELTHVLVRVTGSVEGAERNLDRVMHLGIPCFHATAERCYRSMRLAARSGLSGYDSHYVVLAEELEGRWVTFDAKAARAVSPRSRVRCLAR